MTAPMPVLVPMLLVHPEAFAVVDFIFFPPYQLYLSPVYRPCFLLQLPELH